MRITKSFVDKVPLPAIAPDGKSTQAFYRDSVIAGFGLRVTSGGAKSFIVEKRVDGRVKRKTLGRYGNLTVEQARKEAQKFLGEVAQGRDPIREAQEKRARRITLNEAFQDYLATRKTLKPNTLKDYHRSMSEMFKDWQTKALSDISRDMVLSRHAEYGVRSPARADNGMRILRAIFNHALQRYQDASGKPFLVANPVDVLSHQRAWYKVERRQTLIKDHQLKAWYEATLQLNNQTTRDYLHLVLLTGLRRSEAATLTWDQIDFTEKTLTITVTKNNRIHRLPFSDAIETLLTRRFEERSSPFVFPSDAERGHLSEPRTAIARVAKLSGVIFTLHDLRRTFITAAERLDIPAYALKRLINHKDPNDVTEGYIIFDVERLRGPMQKITDFFMTRFEVKPC
ncbi:tyrosine-type recombinase/integrase [Marinobacter sp. F4216]|uniref:tyrosine-type recombinase/integrase n=1 Tax=Marinobacter sp. F4216 TaxID=2874281 RepID=UPI001CBDE49B|nr:tyrosine-type recombinase/integrase [Marinobacter sp. F4216]MBZ2168032.1 integrase family protein [Marinobacter sp. F4216]